MSAFGGKADIARHKIGYLDRMARTKKPKVKIKREKTSLSWAYRIYINGDYMGAGLTAASAGECAKRMLVIYWRMNGRRRAAAHQLNSTPRVRK